MSSSGTRAGGRSILVALALVVAAAATDQLAPNQLDESLETRHRDGDATDRSTPLPADRHEQGPHTTLPAPAGPVAGPDVDRDAGPITESPTDGATGQPSGAERDGLPAVDTAPDEPAIAGAATASLADLPLDDELSLEGPPASPTATPASPTTQTALRLVYFVEADRDFDPAAVEAIERQAVALQQYWYEQFGGTFRLPAGGVDVVYGDHPAVWYDQTAAGGDPRWNRLTNIRDEVRRKLDLPGDPRAVRTITYPEARIDGRVGANRYEGAWMDGDDISCVTGLVETTPYTLDYPASCLATVAHELGHVYGLGHQGSDEDCMQYGFYRYVVGHALCDFGAENRALVEADPRNAGWLDAVPGELG